MKNIAQLLSIDRGESPSQWIYHVRPGTLPAGHRSLVLHIFQEDGLQHAFRRFIHTTGKFSRYQP